jgi:hypothetical protein
MTATTIPDLDVGDAQQAVNDALAASADVTRRADAGDLDVKPGDLAVARETLDLAATVAAWPRGALTPFTRD